MKFFICFFLAFISCRTETPLAPDDIPLPSKNGAFRIAFGSCNKHNRPQPLWKKILNSDPDLWVWLGDVVYADTRNMNRMTRKYQLQKNFSDYRALEAKIPVIGTWDDHDFGKNGAYKYYPRKKESQRIFLDFMNEPADSPRRKQEGVYASYTFGSDEKLIKIILLDERYFRDRPGEKSDILGEAQWTWLEKELSDPKPRLTFLGSSTQIVGRDHLHDKWSDYPNAEKRLFNIIKKTGIKNLVILAGDRHFGEISKYPEAPIGYPLYEITSSGLTHYKNRFWQDLFGLQKNRFTLTGAFYNLNYGIVDVNFEAGRIMAYICNKNGHVQFKQEILIQELQPHGGN
jgi:alkaline phosphatase D